MTGQELMVNTDNNLIIIGNSLDYKTDINDDGFTTYQIPSDGIACKFSIITASQSTESGLAIRLNDSGLSTEIPIVLQQLLLADIFPIVIKMQDTDWQSSCSAPREMKKRFTKNEKRFYSRYFIKLRESNLFFRPFDIRYC